MWDAFDKIERHAANAKALLARRVEEAGCRRQRGHRDAAERMARKAIGKEVGDSVSVSLEERIDR